MRPDRRGLSGVVRTRARNRSGHQHRRHRLGTARCHARGRGERDRASARRAHGTRPHALLRQRRPYLPLPRHRRHAQPHAHPHPPRLAAARQRTSSCCSTSSRTRSKRSAAMCRTTAAPVRSPSPARSSSTRTDHPWSPSSRSCSSAGGARALGRDKLREPIPESKSGTWLVDRPLAALREVFGPHVAAVGECHPRCDRARFDLVIPDRHPGRGPLGGIVSALEHAQTAVCVLSGDLPLIKPEDVRRMLTVATDHPHALAVLARTDRIEPCIALLPDFGDSRSFNEAMSANTPVHAALDVHDIVDHTHSSAARREREHAKRLAVRGLNAPHQPQAGASAARRGIKRYTAPPPVRRGPQPPRSPDPRSRSRPSGTVSRNRSTPRIRPIPSAGTPTDCITITISGRLPPGNARRADPREDRHEHHLHLLPRRQVHVVNSVRETEPGDALEELRCRSGSPSRPP